MPDQLGKAMRDARRAQFRGSFARFATDAGFTEGHLRSVENGRRAVTDDIARAYDRLLITGGTFETALHIAAETARISDVDRRDFLRVSSLVAVAAVGPGVGGALEVDLREAANPDLWAKFNAAKHKAEVFPELREQLTVVSQTLAKPLTRRARRRALASAADLLQLGGEVLYDANRYADAANCYTSAVAAAREAREPDLWACALTRHAYVSLADHRDEDAVQVLTPAATIARRGDNSLSTQFWVASVQAKAYAGLGRADECLRALDTADQVASMGADVHNGGWLRFDGSRLHEERGACLTALQRPVEAEPVLLGALHRLDPGRRRGAVLADLVAVGAQLRDPERVTTYGTEALRIATATRSGYVVERLVAVQPQLSPIIGERGVAEVARQIRALAVRPTHGAAA